MKRSRPPLPPYIRRCLWSYDSFSIDLLRDRELIITQVLNYGDWEGLQWLFQRYSEGDIKEIVEHPRRGLWLKQVLNFWCLMLKVRLPKHVRERAIFHMEPKLESASQF